MFVRNVTISLPDHVLDLLRERARNERMSLNAWLRHLLTEEVKNEGDWYAQHEKIADDIATACPSWSWNREEIYEGRPKNIH
jgi:hypothetical protein